MRIIVMNVLKVTLLLITVSWLSACGGSEATTTGGDNDTGAVENLVPGVKINGSIQAIPSKNEG